MNTLKTAILTALLGGLVLVPATMAQQMDMNHGMNHDQHMGTPAQKTAKLKPYTLKMCVVSNQKLGEMGQPVVYKYKDREIKFCCAGCVKDFNKAPEKYVKKIEKEEAKAAPSR